MLYKLSIIIPCFNEGIKLKVNIPKIINFIVTNEIIKNYEILIVNDGSTDLKTLEIGNELSNKYTRVKLINYKKNKGKGGAVKEGIIKAQGEWILFMDADLSTDLDAIADIVNCINNVNNNYPMIIGSRHIKGSRILQKQTLLRRIISYCCYLTTNSILHLNIRDTQCGFKAIKKDLADHIVSKQIINRFAFDAEYLYIAKIHNNKILEIPVTWNNDPDSKVKAIKSSLNFLIDLFKIKNNKKNY